MRGLLSALCGAVLLLFTLPTAFAQDYTCTDFDSWIWAQSVYSSNPDQHASSLDPDGNGVACEDLTIRGFAPVLWTDAIPSSAEMAQVTGITDGDTFKVSVNGQADTVRMYHVDTPEREVCGYASASDYLAFVLGFAPNGTVYLEYDQTQRDRYDRRLAYVWFELDGQVYLVNEVMVRGGWAESDAYPPDTKYSEQLNEAEQFSVQHVLGVRLECGKFHQPPGSGPSQQQLREAQQRQPQQGQFAGIGSRNGDSPPPALPTPAPSTGNQSGNCDPSYPGVCIPPRSQVGDLDCKDVEYRRFQVVPPDPHNFDGDFDGVGCEG